MSQRFVIFDVRKSAEAVRALSAVVSDVKEGDTYFVASPMPDKAKAVHFEYAYSKTVASDAGIRLPLMQLSYPEVPEAETMLPALGIVSGGMLLQSLLRCAPLNQGCGWPIDSILLVGNEVKKIGETWAMLFGFALKF